MKICILSDGSSIHIQEWAKYFCDLGHEIYLISEKPTEISGITVCQIKKYEHKIHLPVISSIYQICRKVISIKRILKEIKPDILHSHYANIYGFLGALSKFHPHIMTCHGSDLLVHPRDSRIEKLFVKYALHSADAITLPSTEMKNIAMEFSAPAGKIHKIQYGIETDKFSFTARSDNKINLLSTRNLTPQYCTELILEAVPNLIEIYPNIHLIIAGNGPEKEKLVAQTHRLEIEDSVTFLGHVDHTKISGLYKNADIYITASPTDGLSISLLEAFASGLLPVLPDNPSNSELEQYGFNFILYQTGNPEDLTNKLKIALEEIKNFESKKRDNRKLVEQFFDRDENLKKINAIYHQLIK
ncbi:MAG: glycosyltransferase family 4 protein [Fidelibacterota bacterium]